MLKASNFFNRIWRGLTGKAPQFEGSARSLPFTWGRTEATPQGRNYDLEIVEVPVRDPARSRLLVEMHEHCPELGLATETIVQDALSSADGDDQGFAISKTYSDETPVNSEVFAVLDAARERLYPRSILEMVGDRLLSFGDAFANHDVDLSNKQINSLIVLPTWELFRVEEHGVLNRFEQRRSLHGSQPVALHPILISHFRYRRVNLYGRSLYEESKEDWIKLKNATEDLAAASRAIGYNPTVHVMPTGYTEEQLEFYERAHEERLKKGLISHYYTLAGGDLKKLANSSPDLKALIENVLMWRTRIAMKTHLPFHLFGIQTGTAREISQQPALAYARFINGFRAALTEGITQTFRLELALKGIDPNDPRNRFRLTWPKIYIDPAQAQAGITDEGEQEDTESKLERMYLES